jgi:hypothetical protein
LALDPDLVAFALGFEPLSRPDDSECKELATLLGSREELLAYLFVRTDFLKVHPEIRKVVQNLVLANGVHATTQRPSLGAPIAARYIDEQLRTEILLLANADGLNAEGVNRFDALDKRRALHSREDDLFENRPERWFSS